MVASARTTVSGSRLVTTAGQSDAGRPRIPPAGPAQVGRMQVHPQLVGVGDAVHRRRLRELDVRILEHHQPAAGAAPRSPARTAGRTRTRRRTLVRRNGQRQRLVGDADHQHDRGDGTRGSAVDRRAGCRAARRASQPSSTTPTAARQNISSRMLIRFQPRMFGVRNEISVASPPTVANSRPTRVRLARSRTVSPAGQRGGGLRPPGERHREQQHHRAEQYQQADRADQPEAPATPKAAGSSRRS